MARYFSRLCVGAVGIGIVLTIHPSALAVLQLYEPFKIGASPAAGEYTVGLLDPSDAVGDGQNPASSPTASFWNGAWSRSAASSGQGNIQSAGLSYLGAPAPGGSQVALFESRQSRQLTSPWTDSTTGSYYLSFLANYGRAGGVTSEDLGYRTVEFLSATNQFMFGIGYNTYGTGFTPLTGKLEFDLAALGGRTAITGAPPTFADDGATHLIVLRYNLSSTANSDSILLFLDPLTASEPDVPAFSAANLNLTLGAVRGMTLFGAFASTTFPAFDELRIGTTFADVLPELPTPGDTDGDHDVDLIDYNNIVSHMNQIQVGSMQLIGDVAKGDGTQGSDGKVTIADYRIWRDHFPTVPAPGSGGQGIVETPEPATIAIAFCSAALVVISHRRRRHLPFAIAYVSDLQRA